MAVKYSTISGGGSGTGFNVQIGSQYSYAVFPSPLASGAYTIKSIQGKSNFDVYLLDSNNNLVVYSNTASITPSSAFSGIVIVNGTFGDILQFSYQTTVYSNSETSYVNVGPYITSATPTALPNLNSTIAISGGNFSTAISATFTGTDSVARAAKSVIRNSVTSLTVTRPDVLPISAAPYTLTLTNPGVSNPTASSANIVSGITAGSVPVWNTATTLTQFAENVPYSVTLSATDSNPSGSITYAYVSGSLPSGLSFNSGTGVISGTPTVATPGLYTYTVSATNAGGNTLNRTFTMQDSGPVWTTTGTLPNFTLGSSYSYTLLAPDDSGATPTFALVSGSLPTGLSLSSSGVISGTPASNAGPSSFLVSATDNNGTTTNSGTLTLTRGASSFTSSSLPASFVVGDQITFSDSASFTNWSNANTAQFNVAGAGGGNPTVESSGYGNTGVGGAGALVVVTANKTNLPSFSVRVGTGGIGVGSSNDGSGGGGYSQITRSTDSAVAVVAAGGGGGGGNEPGAGGAGGAGGYSFSGSTASGYNGSNAPSGAGGGGGATGSGGGNGGGGGYGSGGGGSAYQGGYGGSNNSAGLNGGTPGGGKGGYGYGGGGGGGGGYYGGGGGGATSGSSAGGGGGSSYYNSGIVSYSSSTTGPSGGVGQGSNGQAGYITMTITG